MGRLVAIGGGTYEEIDGIAAEIVKLSGKPVPNVLFIGTALKDSTNPLTSCKKTFKRVCPGCIVKKLSIVRTSYTEAEMDELLSWADIIFAGGGDTVYMLEEWKRQGLFGKLSVIFREDRAVLSGVSAGALCWFEMGYTDSDSFLGEENWDYRMIEPGFSFYPAVFCPHYGDYKRKGFDEAFAETGLPGIALEDCTAFVLNGDNVSYLKTKEEAHAYTFSLEDGGIRKEQKI